MATATNNGFHKVANSNDIKEGGLLAVEVEGKRIVLAKVNGKVYAMDAVCSHQGGPLEEGTLKEYNLTCPWHYAVFDVRSGKVSDKTVWATSLDSYPVKVDEQTGDILLIPEASKKSQSQSEATKQQDMHHTAEESQKKYYEEQEKSASEKLQLQLMSKERVEGTDMMTFKLERRNMDFKAGQFGFFRLDGVSGDPKGPTRHFSIASSPTEGDYIMISTRIRDSQYKQRLASLDERSKITTWGPQGEFVLDEGKSAVFLSGGIGVTPFRSMIKYATDKKLPVRIVMFDSNRESANILYKDEFDMWSRENPNLKIIYAVTDEPTDSTWDGERGRINKEMLEKYLTKQEISGSTYYVCGPPGMLKAMHALLEEDMQIPKEKLKVEEFTGY